MAEEKKPEMREKVSRRNLLQVIGAAPAAAAFASLPALAQVDEHHAHLRAPQGSQAKAANGPYQRKVFNDRQWRTVGVLCDLIIPADERSGSATQAGVPEAIDDWIDFRKQQDGNDNLEAQIFGGLIWLDRQSMLISEKEFAGASPDRQKKILDRVAWPERAAKEDHAWVMFFNRFRDLTVSAFFSSKMGVADLPYLGNTAVEEWTGCDPKVWAIIEDRMKNGYKGVAIPEAKPWNG